MLTVWGGGRKLNFSFWRELDAHSLRCSLRVETVSLRQENLNHSEICFLNIMQHVFGAICVVLSHLILKTEQHLCLVKSPLQILIQVSSSTSPSCISFQS